MRVELIAQRVRALLDDYQPPGFEQVPSAEFALFMCAIDHKAGYESEHEVGGRGPFRGSELMWEVAIEHDRHEPRRFTAPRLVAVAGEEVAALLAVDGDTVADPPARAALWRDLAIGLVTGYDPRACDEGAEPAGHAEALLAACGGALGSDGGLLGRLARFEAYADPLQKKSMLFAKICERRGWFSVSDPESWQVCADSVLMRVGLRCGLLEPTDDVEALRAQTRRAWHAVALAAGVAIPVLDDLLWERGRDDPDLLGTEGGDLLEPPRAPRELRY